MVKKIIASAHVAARSNIVLVSGVASIIFETRVDLFGTNVAISAVHLLLVSYTNGEIRWAGYQAGIQRDTWRVLR